MKYSEEIAYSKLVDWCNKAERCHFDIVRKLQSWQALPEFIEACTMRLKKSNLYDDARYASAFAADKSGLQRWGAQKIRLHLKARRIADEYIKEALSELEIDTHRDNIRELLRHKWTSIRGKNEYERTSKLIQFLLRKGFPYDLIREEMKAHKLWLEEFNHL